MTDTDHLDLETLKELREVMGGEFPQLIDTFVKDSAMRLQVIADAVDSAEPEAIRRAAHSFKGSAGNMGATRLTQLCRSLEELGHNGEVAGASQLHEAICAEYAVVEAALRQL